MIRCPTTTGTKLILKKDKEKHTNITWAFIATLGTIVAVNTIM